MIGLSIACSYAFGAARPVVQVSSISCDDDLKSGAEVARLSVSNAESGAWTFSLTDSAAGMFAIDGDTLVIGAAGLDHDKAPNPRIVIRAVTGAKIATAAIIMNVRRTLPTLPLASGARIAAIGDSYTGFNNYLGTVVSPSAASSWAINYTQAYGFIEWARALDPRFDFDSWYDTSDPTGRNISGADQGIFGAHLEWNNEDPTGILTRLPAVLSRKPDILILQGGTNTINSGDIAGSDRPGSAADVIAKLEKGLRLARNEGIWVILLTLYVRGDWPVGDLRYETLAVVNDWIRRQNGRDGVIGILDANEALSPGGTQDPAMFQADKVHLAPAGALIAGRDYLLPIVEGAISEGSVFAQDPTASNIYPVSAAALSGTSGIKGAQISGDVADGVRISINRNASSIICAKSDLGSGLAGQLLTITPANSSSSAYGEVDIALPQLATAAVVAPEDWIYHAFFMEQLSGPPLATARVQFQLRNGSTVLENVLAMNTSSTDFVTPLPLGGNAGWWIKTNPMQLPSDTAFTNLLATVNIYFPKTAAPFRVRLSRPILRKVDDPRQSWGYSPQ